MRRIISMTAALALLLAALVSAACMKDTDPPIEAINGTVPAQNAETGETGEKNTVSIVLKNGLGTTLDEVYLNSADAGNWDQPAASAVGHGESAELDLDFGISLFDIGTIDENGVNYDAFGVRLADGDSILLTGDWESGIFTVTHADGSKDFYTAKVYWSPYGETAEPIALTVQYASETLSDEEGGAIGSFSFQRIVLDADTAKTWPELASAVEDLNASRLGAAANLVRKANAPDGGKEGGTAAVTETAKILRCDSFIVSILYETRIGSAAQSSFCGINIDPKAGVFMTPADIVTDVQKLPHLMNQKLKETDSGLEINEYRDHVQDFSSQCADYAFCMESGSIVFVFNVNAFRSGLSETVRISLDSSDDPFLIKPRFLTAG